MIMEDHLCHTRSPSAAALHYQQHGLAVLGIAPGSKKPHRAYGDRGGVHWATTDHEMVPWLWGQDPRAGVAIATGRASGIVVVDLDVKSGHDGWAEFEAFRKAWSLPVPDWMPVVSTPSGGWHLYLRTWPGEPVPGRTGILPGVDIKGDGGYVLAPPSVAPVTITWDHDRRSGTVDVPYRWASLCPCRIPVAPAWVLDWARNAAERSSIAGGTNGDGRAMPAVEQLARDGLPVGERNTTLYRLACSLFRKYGPTADGMAAVRVELAPVLAATPRADFSQAEVSRTLESARGWIARQIELETEAWRYR